MNVHNSITIEIGYKELFSHRKIVHYRQVVHYVISKLANLPGHRKRFIIVWLFTKGQLISKCLEIFVRISAIVSIMRLNQKLYYTYQLC